MREIPFGKTARLMRALRSTRLKSVGRVAVRVAGLAYLPLLGWIAWQSRDIVLPYLQGVNYALLAGSSLSYVVAVIAVVIGWSAVMRLFARPIPWRVHAGIYFATLAARRLPGTLWYIGGRAALYRRMEVSPGLVSIASSLEMVVQLVSSILVGLILLPTGLRVSFEGLVLFIGLAGAGALVLHPAILTRLMGRIGKSPARPAAVLDSLVWLLAYSAMWVASGFMTSEVVSAFRPLDAQQTLLVIGAWALAGGAGILTMFLPSSFGVTELTLTLFLSQIIPTPLAAAASILVRGLTTLYEVLLSAMGYLMLRKLWAGSVGGGARGGADEPPLPKSVS